MCKLITRKTSCKENEDVVHQNWSRTSHLQVLMENMRANYYHFLQNLLIKSEQLWQRKFKSSIQQRKGMLSCPAMTLCFSLPIFYTLVGFFFSCFPEKFQHFTGLRPRAANNSKLNQAPYTRNNNDKKSLFQDFLNPLTQKEERLVPGQSTWFTIRDVSRKVDFIYVKLHSAPLHIPFPFCYTLPSFSSENPFVNNLNELFEACIPA